MCRAGGVASVFSSMIEISHAPNNRLDGVIMQSGGASRRYEVVRLVQRLSTASLRYVDREGAARGLHRSDLNALQALAEARGAAMSPGELATALALSPSATTTVLDRLERAGHVRRRHDEHDRRRVAVTMTETAGAEARAMFGPLASAMVEAMDDFDDAEVEVIARFLDAAAETIEQAS